MEDFQITSLQRASAPFLAELFLAAVWKFGSKYSMNLMFGFATVLSVVTTYLLYKTLGINKKTTISALLILVFNPMFLAFGLMEFKVEMFLLVIANLSYIAFVRYMNNPKVLTSFVFGTLLAVASLIKVSFLPFAFVLITLFTYEVFSKKVAVFKNVSTSSGKVLHLTTAALSFLVPIALWAYQFGFYIPVININIFSLNSEEINRIVLDKNSEIEASCIADYYEKDLGGFVYSKTTLAKILQPYYIFTNNPAHHRPLKSVMTDPGFLLYFSLLLFPFLILLVTKKRRENRAWRYFYIFTVTGIVMFYLQVGVLFWYIYPLYPFIALGIPLCVEFLFTKVKHKKTIEILVYSAGLAYFMLLFTFIFLLLSEGYFTKQLMWLFEINTKVNTLERNKLILNAFEHPYSVPLTFAESYDKRIINSGYYFASADKPLADIHTELLNHNVGYIVVSEKHLLDAFYTGCPLKNNQILKEYLGIYTEPVYVFNEMNFIFKLKPMPN